MAFKLEDITTEESSTKEAFNIDALLKKEIRIFGNGFSNKKKEAFYIELNVLLVAGLALKDGLLLLVDEQKKDADKKLLKGIVGLLIEGSSLSVAISHYKEFSEYEYYSLKIGEETGTLKKVTKELGAFYKRKNEQRRTIIGALSYPLVVLFTAFLAVFFMLQFVVPMFADIFKQNNVELPWITKGIMAASVFFQKYYWLGLVVVGSIFSLVYFNKKKNWYRKLSSNIVLKIPFVGEFVRKVKIAQFTQAITLLTGAKIPLLNGIQLTKKMINYYPLQEALVQIEKDILIGKNLHESLAKYKVFDSKMVSLIKVAEETNQNETIFQRLTEQYNEEINYKSKMISATIEPFIILILGGIVAVILIAMYLPMFKLSTVIS